MVEFGQSIHKTNYRAHESDYITQDRQGEEHFNTVGLRKENQSVTRAEWLAPKI